MYFTVCPLRGLGLIPSHSGVFQGIFPWLITLCQPVRASVAEKGSISPQWHHTTCGNRGGRPKSNHGQTMAERNKTVDTMLEKRR